MDEIDIYFKQLEEYREPIDIILDIDDIFKKKTASKTHKHKYIYDRQYGCQVCSTCGVSSEPGFVIEKSSPSNNKQCRRMQHLMNILNNVQHRFKPDIDDAVLQAIKLELSKF